MSNFPTRFPPSNDGSKLRDEPSAKNSTDIDNNTLTLVRSSQDPKERGNAVLMVLVILVAVYIFDT